MARCCNADLSRANLSHADLSSARLTNADLSGATVTGAIFYGATSRGFTPEQLYSTASYQTHDLQDIALKFNDLSGWDFRGQNLSHADLSDATLTNADLSGANLNHANLSYATLTNTTFIGANLYGADFRFSEGLTIDPSAMTRNMISPAGEIDGLDVRSGESLRLSSYSDRAALVIRASFSMEDGGVLSLTPYSGSVPIQFIDVSPAELGGTLQLAFPYFSREYGDTYIGSTYDLFDWPGPLESTNRFSAVVGPPGWIWDTSRLYTTGEVTLLAIVPEPASLNLVTVLITLSGSWGVMRRRSHNQRSLAVQPSSA